MISVKFFSQTEFYYNHRYLLTEITRLLNQECYKSRALHSVTHHNFLFFFFVSKGNSELPTAVNITWSSINFKTILQWQPEPTTYVYTVEISGINSNWEKVCIHTKETECDVTDKLEKIKDTYTAHIVPEMLSETEKFEEPSYAISPKFTPYNQTKIGRPGIQTYELTDSKLKVLVEDPLTPYRFPNKSFKSIRDIFKNDLEYTLYYWKDQSTGKKEVTSKSNQFEISVDKGKNYCFYVQATILSRKENRKSQESKVNCTHQRDVLDGTYLVKQVNRLSCCLFHSNKKISNSLYETLRYTLSQ
uniref:Tissue factor n=1 Tax=Chelydra serpentina TaxID=8475 RepID=A0A8C3T818_CHESE